MTQDPPTPPRPSPRQCSTNTRSSPIFVSRGASCGKRSAASSSGMKRPEWSSSPAWHELGDGVDEPGAAHSDRLAVADHLELDLVLHDLEPLDRPVGGAHPATDLGRLERRAGRGRGGHHPLDGAERDLGVGADVDEQPQPPVAGQARREHPGDDVAADVGAERGEHERRARAGARRRRSRAP